MRKNFYDYTDGDFARTISDNMAMDMKSRDIHFISRWSAEDDD